MAGRAAAFPDWLVDNGLAEQGGKLAVTGKTEILLPLDQQLVIP